MALSDRETAASLQVRIGGISISLDGDLRPRGCGDATAYEPFLADGKPDIRLTLHRGPFEPGGGEKVFDSPPVWSLHRCNGSVFFKIFPRMPGLGRSLVLSPARKNADLYFSGKSSRFPDPFFGPTLELLMVDSLARGKGAILHGCGIAMGRRGILFVGESGAGKSTLANLCSREHGVRVLSDDRIIIRKEGGKFRMHGTPWHGTGRFGSPLSVPLDRILFLKHGHRNAVGEIGEMAAAAARLLACSFPPLWDAPGMAFTLKLLQELVRQVPCGELSFRPDRSAVEYLVAEQDQKA